MSCQFSLVKEHRLNIPCIEVLFLFGSTVSAISEERFSVFHITESKNTFFLIRCYKICLVIRDCNHIVISNLLLRLYLVCIIHSGKVITINCFAIPPEEALPSLFGNISVFCTGIDIVKCTVYFQRNFIQYRSLLRFQYNDMLVREQRQRLLTIIVKERHRIVKGTILIVPEHFAAIRVKHLHRRRVTVIIVRHRHVSAVRTVYGIYVVMFSLMHFLQSLPFRRPI